MRVKFAKKTSTPHPKWRPIKWHHFQPDSARWTSPLKKTFNISARWVKDAQNDFKNSCTLHTFLYIKIYMNLEIWIYAREEEGNETVTWLELPKFWIFFLIVFYFYFIFLSMTNCIIITSIKYWANVKIELFWEKKQVLMKPLQLQLRRSDNIWKKLV